MIMKKPKQKKKYTNETKINETEKVLNLCALFASLRFVHFFVLLVLQHARKKNGKKLYVESETQFKTGKKLTKIKRNEN